MAIEQARWNTALGTPCEFFLLNPIDQSDDLKDGVDLVRVDAGAGDTKTQCRALRELLDSTGPSGVTPIAERLRKIEARVARDGANFVRSGQKVVLVIVTDGAPTSTDSNHSGPAQREELVKELMNFSRRLPVSVVVRLCTEDASIMDFYGRVRDELELQMKVIGDLTREARRIHQVGNNSLVYSPLIHMIREGGAPVQILGLLDERRLDATEIVVVAQLLLRRSGDPPFPIETQDFVSFLRERLSSAAPVYDAINRRMSPPLRLHEVERALKRVSTVFLDSRISGC